MQLQWWHIYAINYNSTNLPIHCHETARFLFYGHQNMTINVLFAELEAKKRAYAWDTYLENKMRKAHLVFILLYSQCNSASLDIHAHLSIVSKTNNHQVLPWAITWNHNSYSPCTCCMSPHQIDLETYPPVTGRICFLTDPHHTNPLCWIIVQWCSPSLVPEK